MSRPPDDAVEVLSGSAATDLRWVVVAYRDGDDLYTLLRVYRGDRKVVAGSGFGGPALAPGSVLAEWRGRADACRFRDGAYLPGLRFAAAALPDGEQPAGLRAERQGTVLESVPQRIPPRRRPDRR